MIQRKTKKDFAMVNFKWILFPRPGKAGDFSIKLTSKWTWMGSHERENVNEEWTSRCKEEASVEQSSTCGTKIAMPKPEWSE